MWALYQNGEKSEQNQTFLAEHVCARMWQTFKNIVNVHQIFVAGLPLMSIIVEFIIYLFPCTKSIVLE